MKRLLFVDDEPRLLQGLKQSLRGQRKVWEMFFVESGELALEKIRTWQLDAVVSDMRMPGMDGAELLTKVRAIQPDTLRIVLSGQMDENTACRAAAAAHRFLAKPCETETLIATLSRALELQEQLSSDELRKCIGGMASLPSLPASCAALNRALQNPDVRLSEVVQIIENDVGMSVKVLQLVNSSFFGLSRHIAAIEQAVMHLGLGAVRSLVLTNALFERLSNGDTSMVQAEQARSLLAARYARRFALDRRQSDIAVTAAMLHDVGRLALLARLPKECARARAYAQQHGVPLADAELVHFGVTHAAVGAHLLGLWGLPLEVVQVVGCQHASLDTLTSLEACSVVYLARALAAEATDAVGPDAVPLPAELCERLGVAHVVAAAREEIAALRLDSRVAS
jgi:HD-like signal output (HDOD) protein/CheY-like chemotaxis protein